MIVIIKDPKSLFPQLGHSIRNNQISFGQGGLLINEGDDSDIKTLLEKIITAVKFPDVVPDKWEFEIPWKPASKVIFIGDGVKRMKEIEGLLPEFQDKFGPVVTITVT